MLPTHDISSRPAQVRFILSPCRGLPGLCLKRLHDLPTPGSTSSVSCRWHILPPHRGHFLLGTRLALVCMCKYRCCLLKISLPIPTHFCLPIPCPHQGQALLFEPQCPHNPIVCPHTGPLCLYNYYVDYPTLYQRLSQAWVARSAHLSQSAMPVCLRRPIPSLNWPCLYI